MTYLDFHKETDLEWWMKNLDYSGYPYIVNVSLLNINIVHYDPHTQTEFTNYFGRFTKKWLRAKAKVKAKR